MQKKTKFRSKIKVFSRFELISFFISELICLIMIFSGGFAYYKRSSSIRLKSEEIPVAYVSSKIKTSRRCFEKHNVWDILKENSYIYNGDIIYTEPNSLATLVFSDGVELTLSEDTMTQIIVGKDNELKINLSSGNVIVDSSVKAKPTTIIYNDSAISMQGKAMVSAAEIKENEVKKSEDKKPALEVQVLEGKAQVKTKNNKSVEVKNGQKVKIAQVKKQNEVESVNNNSKENTETTISEPELIVTEKGDTTVSVLVKTNKKLESKSKAVEKDANTKIISEAVVKAAEVKTEKNKTNSKENIADLTKIQKFIDESEKDVPVKKSVTKAKVNSKPEVDLDTPILLKPAKGKVFDDNYFLENQYITFVWKQVSGATNYKFILKNENGKILKEVMLGNVSSYTLNDLSILTPGQNTYWQIEAIKKQNGNIVATKKTLKSHFIVKLGEISGDASLSGNLYSR